MLKSMADRLDQLSHIPCWRHRRRGNSTPLIRRLKRLNFGSGRGPCFLPSPSAEMKSDWVAVTDDYSRDYGDGVIVIGSGTVAENLARTCHFLPLFPSTHLHAILRSEPIAVALRSDNALHGLTFTILAFVPQKASPKPSGLSEA